MVRHRSEFHVQPEGAYDSALGDPLPDGLSAERTRLHPPSSPDRPAGGSHGQWTGRGGRQDAAAYQDLLDRLDRAEAIVGINRGLVSMRRGEGRPAEEVLEELRAELGMGTRVG
jgi:hypothetical protein